MGRPFLIYPSQDYPAHPQYILFASFLIAMLTIRFDVFLGILANHADINVFPFRSPLNFSKNAILQSNLS